jgi:lipopolysaccharide export system permease protein
MVIFNEKIVLSKFLSDNNYAFLLSSLSITFVVWTIQAVNNLDIVSEDGHSFLIYFYYTLLLLPKIFSNLLPVIFFTTLFYNIIKYENNNELKIFWINGISKVQFYNAILKYTLVFFFIQVSLTSFLVPHLQNKGKEYIKESTLDFFPSLFQEKKFIDTVSKLTVFIESKNSNGEFYNIYLKDETNKYPRIIIAKKGQLLIIKDRRFLRLLDGKFINVNELGAVTVFDFKKTDFNLSKFLTKTTTYAKLQERKTTQLLSCLNDILIKNKPDTSKEINCNYDSIKDIMSEIYSRIFKPLYLFLLSSIAIFILTSNNEQKKFKKTTMFVFLLGIISIVVSEISVDYSGKNNINMLVTIFFPLFIFLVLYVLFYKRVTYSNYKK